MKLLKYLEKNSINKFRTSTLKLVGNKGADASIEEVLEKYNKKYEVENLITELNYELRKFYGGKYKFDICLEDEGQNLEDIKIDQNKLTRIKNRWLKYNDKFSDIKLEMERELKNSGGYYNE